MGKPRQSVHFATTTDGVRLAYAIAGNGPPIVRIPSWMTHLEHDWENPLLNHWLNELASRHTLVRFDQRGVGLSDRDVTDISFDAWVHDMETVVDAARLERFAIWGNSQAPAVAIAYAVRHPERVSHMVFLGSYCRGSLVRDPSPAQVERCATLRKLIELGWGQNNPAFRQLFTSRFVPEATKEQADWYNELQKRATSPENAVRYMEATGEIDVSHLLAQVRVPTLVLHAREDAAVPFDLGRRMAAGIPGARFVPLDSKNHILLEHEPAFSRFLEEMLLFLKQPSK